MKLSKRDRQPERMDQPDLDFELHSAALRGLGRVNRFSGSVGSIWKPIAALARSSPDRTFRVLDVACGGGDIAIGLKQKAERHGLTLDIVGCDISPTAIGHANDAAARRKVHVSFIRQDVLGGQLPAGFDVVYSSLFLHHLDAHEVVGLLRAMASAAGQQVVVSDLLRTWTGYHLAKWGIRLLTSSKVCRVDAPLSVRGAFTFSEVRSLVERAELKDVVLKRQWPERFLMVCETKDDQDV